MSFDIVHIWQSTGLSSKVIFFLMVVMGIASIYVGIERQVTFSKARKQSRALASALAGAFQKDDIGAALQVCQDTQYKFSYLGHLMEVGLKEINTRFDKHGIANAQRAMERKIIQETTLLKRGMNILATVGATAPFVGLIGTILGIIAAFQSMAEAGSGGLAAVSAGIAEALIATAVGIFVALIGVWLFNYFSSVITLINDDIEISIAEFIDWCEKRLLQEAEADPDTELAPAK